MSIFRRLLAPISLLPRFLRGIFERVERKLFLEMALWLLRLKFSESAITVSMWGTNVLALDREFKEMPECSRRF